MPAGPLRAILYARVSSDDSATGGANLADQLRLCREHAERRSWDVLDEIAEDVRGASGADADLPGLRRALDLAEAGAYDVLIVRELDRLSRSLAKQLVVEDELKRHGVTVAYALQDYAPTPEGDLMRHIRGAIAEYERELIAARMMRAKRRIVRNGEVMAHGRAPLGYVLAGENGSRTLAPDPNTAPIVRDIFARYAAGESIRAITRALTERGVPTYGDRHGHSRPTREGKWAYSTVGAILANETYAGTWEYAAREPDGSPLPPVAVPALVDPATWKAVQERRARNRRGTPRTKREYLLVGHLACGECGYSMAALTAHVDGRTYMYYECPNGKKTHNYIRPCTMRRRWRVETLDTLAWDWVHEILLDSDRLRVAVADQAAERERRAQPLRALIAERRRLLERHEERMDVLTERHLDGTLGLEEYRRVRGRHEAEATGWRLELNALSRELATLETEVPVTDPDAVLALAREVANGLEKAGEDFAARRRVIEMLHLSARLCTDAEGAWLHVEAVFGADRLPVPSNSTRTSRSCTTSGPTSRGPTPRAATPSSWSTWGSGTCRRPSCSGCGWGGPRHATCSSGWSATLGSCWPVTASTPTSRRSTCSTGRARSRSSISPRRWTPALTPVPWRSWYATWSVFADTLRGTAWSWTGPPWPWTSGSALRRPIGGRPRPDDPAARPPDAGPSRVGGRAAVRLAGDVGPWPAPLEGRSGSW